MDTEKVKSIIELIVNNVKKEELHSSIHFYTVSKDVYMQLKSLLPDVKQENTFNVRIHIGLIKVIKEFPGLFELYGITVNPGGWVDYNGLSLAFMTDKSVKRWVS